MSKPDWSATSNGSRTGFVSVPSFGGFWTEIVSFAESIAYSIVAAGRVALNDEFVYAAPTTRGMPGFSARSLLSSVPSSTFRRRFWPASETTRILSTVGLKSTPKKRPLQAGRERRALGDGDRRCAG